MVAETNAPADVIVEAVVANNEETVAKVRKASARRKTNARKPRKAAEFRQEQAAANERNDDVNFQTNNAFAGFEKMFGEFTGRIEDAAQRSRKAAEDLAEITRGNVEAMVEAGRIAAAGAQSIGQSVIAKSRDNLDQAANTVRSLTSARTPADLLQLQADFLRGSFDRFVAESSELTESMVKLAGESFQPISNRTTQNVERFNDLVA